eukprot:g6862.t1
MPRTQELGRMSPSSQWNFWWVEKGWRWRLVPEAEPPDHGAYFRKAFCMPYYAFSDGRLGEQLEVKNGLRHPDDHHQTEFSQAEQREQPVFNSLLFESIYSHSEVCLVLRGDTADGTKRLWDAITRGCVPAFASSSIHWPLLPFWTQVPWQEFSFFFYGVNSSGKAFNVLETLRRLGPSLLRRKRQRLRQWLPSLVVEPQTCGMRRAHGRNRTGATGSTPAAARLAPPTALQLAMAEDPSDPEAPSLMWLLAEDGATEHSHVRVCDRNFVVLKVKRLLLNMEKDPFAGVFRSGCCSDMVCTDAHTPAAWCTTPCPPFRIRLNKSSMDEAELNSLVVKAVLKALPVRWVPSRSFLTASVQIVQSLVDAWLAVQSSSEFQDLKQARSLYLPLLASLVGDACATAWWQDAEEFQVPTSAPRRELLQAIATILGRGGSEVIRRERLWRSLPGNEAGGAWVCCALEDLVGSTVVALTAKATPRPTTGRPPSRQRPPTSNSTVNNSETHGAVVGGLALLMKGTAWAQVKSLDGSKLSDPEGGVKLLLGAVASWEDSAELQTYDKFERALYRVMQKQDESLFSYVNRMNVAFAEIPSVSIQEIKAFIMLRQSYLNAEDKKRVLSMTGGELQAKKVEDAMRQLAPKILVGSSGNDSKKKVYPVNYVEEDEDNGAPAFIAEEDYQPDEETGIQTLLDQGDEDALMVAEFEDQLVEACVMTLRDWGDQVLAGGKHVGKTFAQALAVDASYGEFMKKKGDLTSPWAMSFQNYVRALEKANQMPKMEPRQMALTPTMMAKMKQEWAMNGATATDWDVIEEWKDAPSSEVPAWITTSASGSTAAKRGHPADEEVWNMKVEISHEASLRVEQIPRQIALLQDEMRRILPAEAEDA